MALDPTVPLRVATANIHAKVFDDEVVVLDMGAGTYFSLRGAAAAIWPLVDAHATPAAITAAFTGPGVDAAAIDGVLDQLTDARLVVGDPALDAGTVEPASLPFEVPVVETYTDMQDLLLLDPIHDVDESGWPHSAA